MLEKLSVILSNLHPHLAVIYYSLYGGTSEYICISDDDKWLLSIDEHRIMMPYSNIKIIPSDPRYLDTINKQIAQRCMYSRNIY